MSQQRCEHCAALNPSTGEICRQTQSPLLSNVGNFPVNVNGTETLQESRTSLSDTPPNGIGAMSVGDLEKNAEQSGKDEEKGGDLDLPASVGIFHSSLNKLRLEVFGLWARTVLIISTFILCVLSIYWAVLYHVESNISSLDVFVVDFDGTQSPYQGGNPLIGPMVTETTEMMLRSPDPHLGFVTMTPAQFNNDPLAVRQAVYDFKAYAAIVVNANATALLRAAVEQGNASYDPLGACQVIWLEARDQDTYYDYILPQLSALQTELTSKFGRMWTSTVLRNSSIPVSNLQAAPQALSPAIGFSQFSLRPFNPPVIIPAVSIGLIYLIIIAFFSFSFFLPIYTKLITPSPSSSGSNNRPPIHLYQLILIRYLGTNLAYLFMSLAYSLISLAFQISFSSPPAPTTIPPVGTTNPTSSTKATFVIYWMINFAGMSALGLACENVAMFIGQPWTAMWLIFWVITNVATAFYSLDLSPRFYYWGYAWPLHNIVEASRSVLFDLHSRLGLNFGVLAAWVGMNSALFPVACWVMRWKTQRGGGGEGGKSQNG